MMSRDVVHDVVHMQAAHRGRGARGEYDQLVRACKEDTAEQAATTIRATQGGPCSSTRVLPSVRHSLVQQQQCTPYWSTLLLVVTVVLACE